MLVLFGGGGWEARSLPGSGTGWALGGAPELLRARPELRLGGCPAVCKFKVQTGAPGEDREG